MTPPRMMPLLILCAGLALLTGCDEEMPPQITACDQLPLADPEEIDTFLTLNNGLTCDFAPPEGEARYACNRGPTFMVCGMPSEISTAGCNCVDGLVECFNRQSEADEANDMCGS